MENQEQRIQALPSTIWSLVSQIDALKGQWIHGVKLHPQVLGRLKRSTLASSTGASTRIEGSRMSDEDVEKMMGGLSIQKFSERDQQEVRGYFELLNTIFDSWKYMVLSESLVKQFHGELLKYAEKDERHRGEYKKMENAVEMFDPSGKSLGVVFETSPAYLTPKQTAELIAWTSDALKKGEHHPLIIIGNFLVEFLAIHPFQDGNGRLSRILTNFLLLKAGYEYAQYVSHEKYIEEDKAQYYIALRRSQMTLRTEQPNVLSWLEFFLKITLVQSQQAILLLSQENLEKILSPKQLLVWRYLETVIDASPKEVMEHTTVLRKTVSQALDALMKLKRIVRTGNGRTTRYRRT